MKSKINEFLNHFIEKISNRNVMQASLWLFLYSSLPTLVLGAAATIAVKYFAPNLFQTLGNGAGQQNLDMFPALVFNPIIETLILASLIVIGVKLKAGKFAIVIPALILAALHSVQNSFWGVTVFSFFLIQSYGLFHIFQSGFMRSCIVTSAAHAMHNAWILSVVFLFL